MYFSGGEIILIQTKQIKIQRRLNNFYLIKSSHYEHWIISQFHFQKEKEATFSASIHSRLNHSGNLELFGKFSKTRLLEMKKECDRNGEEIHFIKVKEREKERKKCGNATSRKREWAAIFVNLRRVIGSVAQGQECTCGWSGGALIGSAPRNRFCIWKQRLLQEMMHLCNAQYLQRTNFDGAFFELRGRPFLHWLDCSPELVSILENNGALFWLKRFLPWTLH